MRLSPLNFVYNTIKIDLKKFLALTITLMVSIMSLLGLPLQ